MLDRAANFVEEVDGGWRCDGSWPSSLLFAGAGELAAQRKGKGIRLWNLTTATISGFQLSPAGKNAWGPNLTLNDKDKEVDHDERLRITGVEPGRYDAKVSYPDQGNASCAISKSRRTRCSRSPTRT